MPRRLQEHQRLVGQVDLQVDRARMHLGEAVRVHETRRLPTDPLLPFVVSALAGAVAAVAGIHTVVWLLAGLMAGHSLSGSA
jgi:hypothetical protein